MSTSSSSEHALPGRPWLRYWAMQINGETGSMLLKGRAYPFAGVVDSGALADARAKLDAAYARERQVARDALSGLP